MSATIPLAFVYGSVTPSAIGLHCFRRGHWMTVLDDGIALPALPALRLAQQLDDRQSQMRRQYKTANAPLRQRVAAGYRRA